MTTSSNVIRLLPGSAARPRPAVAGASSTASSPAFVEDPMLAPALLDDHGEELLSMARVITGSVDTACKVVSQVLLEAGDLTEVPRGDPSSRTALALRVFDACEPALADRDATPESASEAMAWLSDLCERQRRVLALHLYGCLTTHQIGTLLSLPVWEVRVLLRAAVDELALAHRRDDAPVP